MKRYIIITSILCFISATYGQNAKVASALNFLKRSQLEKAKEAIDTAITNEQTKDKTKTWFIRGVIYYVMDTITDPKVKALIGEPLEVASAAFDKANQLDPNYTSLDVAPILTPRIGLEAVAARYFNAGVAFYSSADFANASAKFEKSVSVSKLGGKVDTLAIYNTAMTAEKAHLTKKALEYYEILVNFNLNETTKSTLDINRYAKSFASLANIYLELGYDKAKAYDIILRGRKNFPNSFDVIIDEVNFHIKAKDYEKAIKSLDEASVKDPSNANLYYVKANMANVVLNEELYANDTTTYGKNFRSAEVSYKKATELKPDYFDSYFNLGALYVNKAVAIMYVANKLDVYDPKYNILKDKADKILVLAIPQIEKAFQLDSKNKDCLLTLKNIFSRLQQADKLKEVNEKLEALK